MTNRQPRGLTQLAARVAQRDTLDRDQLLALVEALQSLAQEQQQTLDRQAAAINRLQSTQQKRETEPPVRAPTPVRATVKPVPGSDYTIVFDGGAIGNPGRGYGSFQIVGAGGVLADERLQYGDNVTNNQAEYLTIIRALANLRERLGDAAKQARIAIRGDSQLVLNTLTGKWKARHPGLIPLHREAVTLLREFGRADVKWQPRAESVAILGH